VSGYPDGYVPSWWVCECGETFHDSEQQGDMVSWDEPPICGKWGCGEVAMRRISDAEYAELSAERSTVPADDPPRVAEIKAAALALVGADGLLHGWGYCEHACGWCLPVGVQPGDDDDRCERPCDECAPVHAAIRRLQAAAGET